MKKRIVSGLVAMVLVFGLAMMGTEVDAKASDGRPASESIGSTGGISAASAIGNGTMGEHLQIGYSKLRVMGPGVIVAGGTTIGEHTCNSIQVTVSVERAQLDDDEWEVVEVWHAENNNADLVSTTKRLEVDGGWYYRVRCTHSADGDMSDSATDGLYVEEP